MMKSYLRFEPKATFGIISSPQCNVVYDFTGNLAITGAVQDVNVWNLRQASQVWQIFLCLMQSLIVDSDCNVVS